MVEHERRRADAEFAGLPQGLCRRAGAGPGRSRPEDRRRARGDRRHAGAPRAAGFTASRRGWRPKRCRSPSRSPRKLAPELIAREPFAEIAALASECFRQLVSTPHIGIRIGDAIFESAKQKLDDIAHKPRLRRPAGRGGRSDASRPATAASNGPTAASSATAPRPKPPSTTWSAATSRRARADTN